MAEEQVLMKEVTDAERASFLELAENFASNTEADGGIGTYMEKGLHRLLKCYFEPDRQYHEIPVGKYIADIKNGCITEIQTASLSGIKEKLAVFLCENRVRVVFPLETVRHIVWIDPSDGSASKRNRSPKPDNIYRLLAELVYILDHVENKNLTVTAVHLAIDEYRLLDGWSRDKKKGSTKLERVPTDIFGFSDFSSLSDYAGLVPEDLPSAFTRDDFSASTGLRGRKLWAGIRVLEALKLVSRVPSSGRKYRYATTEEFARLRCGAKDAKKSGDFS